MTSLLARIGVLESRLASQLLWTSGKRRRGDWVCVECRGRRALRQRRYYSDDAVRADQHFQDSPPRARLSQRIDEDKGVPRRTALRSHYYRSARPGAWGLDDGERSAGAAEERVVLNDAEESREHEQDALWQQFERLGDDDVEMANEGQQFENSWGEPDLLNVDYASNLLPALANNEFDMVARCLFAAANSEDMKFIHSIPATTFAECIRVLSPSNTIDLLGSIHVDISEGLTWLLRITSMRQVAFSHSQLLWEILEIRRSAGITLGGAEYKILLRSARDLGNLKMASKLWYSLLGSGLKADTACYNYRMESYVRNKVHDARSRQKARVVPLHMEARRALKRGPQFANYSVGEQGMKMKVMNIFRDMLKHGVEPDVESHRIVIAAAAREGEVVTVKSVLKLVWGIDVDALLAGNEVDIMLKETDKTSPLRPTSKVLSTLAHAFGINNDVSTAFRLVDFMAQKYDIPVGTDTWGQFLEWTFVLAQYRSGSKVLEQKTRTGELPKRSLSDLWETMTRPPYSIKPTMAMYDRLIKCLYTRGGSTREMYEKMTEGKPLYYESHDRARQAFDTLKEAVERDSEAPASHTGKPLPTLNRERELFDLTHKRHRKYLQRWVRLLLYTMESWISHDNSLEWSVRTIPRMLWEWRDHAPDNISYGMYSGIVNFRIRTDEENTARKEDTQLDKREAWDVVKKAPSMFGEHGLFLKPRIPNSHVRVVPTSDNTRWGRYKVNAEINVEGQG